MSDLSTYRRALDRREAARRAAQLRLESARTRLAAANAKLGEVTAARELLQGVAAGLQREAQKAVADCVTAALRAVFGPDAYEFTIRLEERRGKTEADLYLSRDGVDYSPLDSAGGGVCDICSFALRLAALLLSRPAGRKLLCLDEPFKHLSRDHAGRVGELLERLCRELDLQIIQVTHSRELAVGAIVEMG